MRFLVTGATGFVGRHLVPQLMANGQVTTLQRPDGPAAPPAASLTLFGDVTRPEDLAGLGPFDAVVHLAAEASPQRAAQDPAAARRINVEGTANVLALARDAGARFVFLSTGQVYGPSAGRPFRETDPVHPAGPYATSKVAAEALVAAARQDGAACTTLRCFNMYGPGQVGPYVVPTIMEALVAGRTPAVRDLAPARDFLYIGDAARAMALAAMTRDTPPVLNVAAGRTHTIAEVVRTACGLAGVAPPEGPSIHADRIEADNRLLRSLGWAPEVDLETGLRATLDWWRSP